MDAIKVRNALLASCEDGDKGECNHAEGHCIYLTDEGSELLKECTGQIRGAGLLLNAVPRREVALFSRLMELKLLENAHKGHWGTSTARQLLRRLRQETNELERALEKLTKAEKTGDPSKVQFAVLQVAREAADVGNFAMMVTDVTGGLEVRNDDAG